MENRPKVFICHSSKDKYFVENLVRKLRFNGIDAWYDDYEISLGDNIIEKINNGLKKSDKGIIIFSNNFFKSEFALNEMDSIIFDYIYDDKYTIIPIILDENIEIPKLINHISPVRIKDIKNYDSELSEISDRVFGKKELPTLNEPPTYYNLKQIPNCTKQDTEIFKTLGDHCLKNGFDEELYPSTILNICDYNEREIEESLIILEENNYIKNEGAHSGMSFLSKSFTSKGFYFYLVNFTENGEQTLKNVVKSIYNEKEIELTIISKKNNVNLNIVKGIIEMFKKYNYIDCELNLNISSITPKGERYFYNFLNK